MAAKTTNYFTELTQVNIDKHVEKKGKFNYISWANAIRELKKIHPKATWIVHKHGEEGLPYLKTECGFFVEITVTVNGVDATELYPVTDHNNKTLTAPTASEINTNIKRCLAKAIALHGLGIHLYAGEDLPPSKPIDTLQQKELLDLLEDRSAEKDLLDKVMSQISSGTINQGNFRQAMEHYNNTL